MKQRQLLTLTLVLLVFASLVGASVQAQDPVTLDVWTKYNPGNNAARYAAFEEVSAAFEAENPDITINHVYFQPADFTTTVQLAMDSGEAGCIVQADIGANLVPWYQQGYLTPLDEYAQQYGWVENDTTGAIKTANLTMNPSTVYDGPEIVGLPNIYQPLGVFYNKDTFAKYGVTPPETWDEFVNILQTFKDAGVTPLTLGNGQQWHGLHYLSSFIAANVPIDRLRAWWQGDTSVKFTDPDFLWAAQTAQDWAKAGYFNNDFNAVNFDDAMGLFLSGEQPMLLTGDWNVPRMLDSGMNIGFFPVPATDSNTGWTIVKMPDWPFTITNWCQNKDEAAKFLDFLVSSTGSRAFYKQGMQPVFAFDSTGLEPSSLQQDVSNGIVGKQNGFYVDSVDTAVRAAMWPANQLLYDGSLSPEDFAQQMQDARDSYLSEHTSD